MRGRFYTLLLLAAFTPFFASAATCPTLSRGMSGANVSAVQRVLYDAYQGFPSPTGYFGSITQAAVKQWQGEHGIEKLGIVGPKTAAAMKITLCSNVPTSTNITASLSAPTQTPSSVADLIKALLTQISILEAKLATLKMQTASTAAAATSSTTASATLPISPAASPVPVPAPAPSPSPTPEPTPTSSNAIVILATGQSNMEISNPYSWSPPANLHVWNNPHNSTGVGNAFVPAEANVSRVATMFAALIARTNPGRDVYLINDPYGGMPIEQWLPNSTDPDMYTASVKNVQAALATLPGKSTVDFFLWWQGESSAWNRYADKLGTVMARYESQAWFASHLGEIFFGLNSANNPIYPGPSGYDSVTTEIQNFVAKQPGQRKFVPTGDLAFNGIPPAGVHLGAQGQVDAANRAFGILTSTPTATLTANGSSDITVDVGDVLNYAWSSTGGVSAASTILDVASDGARSGPLPWIGGSGQKIAATLAGSLKNSTVAASQAGHTYTVTYTVTAQNGQTSSATLIVRVRSADSPSLHIYANGKEGSVVTSKGSAAFISWLAQDMQKGSCAVYGPAASPLDSTNLFNGSGSLSMPSPGQGTPALSQVAVFTLRCVRFDGSYATATVTVQPQ